MKTFRRTYRPEKIKYNGETYTPNATISGAMLASRTKPEAVAMAVRTTGKKAVLVEVLSRNLKGKTDLHGKPYEPTKHIYTT